MSDLPENLKAITVAGPIHADEMGITLPHEHLLIDLRNQFTEFADPERQRISRQPLSSTNIAAVRDNPYAIRDNLLLDDIDLAADEIRPFLACGGKTIVDCTSVGIGRSPRHLAEIAARTGVHIIVGCGYYTHDTHPPAMNEWSAEHMARALINELTVGIDGTTIRAGVIGEIGVSDPIHPNERKVLIASALAFQETSAPIQVHIDPWGQTGIDAADLLLHHGVDPGKIAICHADILLDRSYMRSLLERGVFVEFDNFGKEFHIDGARRFATDAERIDALRSLIDEGFASQILVTNDVCLKSMLHRYGGRGYDHLLTHIAPKMLAHKIDLQTIVLWLIANPQRLYCWATR